ncbi:MAG: hypothetical protein ACREQ5_17865, partial [Candidatus Dormibacteria bacterium]
MTSGDAASESNLERGADGTITVHPLRGRSARSRAIAYAAPGVPVAAFWVLREAFQSPRFTVVLLLLAVPAFGLSVLVLRHYLRTNRI